ncbi:MAG TPA: SDR family NAD(P)-dependent oxidoreductase [Verrucomicrobiae bacterium]|nr:SDR family NAD(P)-dependent oxidoreductase [Verrucomicrobiae bacterium]
MSAARRPVAVVTGASAGIGAACARQLAAAGYWVWLGARRLALVEELAREVGGVARPLDVTDADSVEAFATGLSTVDVLVNNAGGARGREPVEAISDQHWRWMWEVNVLGLVRMTRALLPQLERSGAGHIVNMGSVAGFEVYEGGAGYTSAKHAVRAITRTLRLELVERPIRVTEIDPGMVETDFSRRRFLGDEARAAEVYRGVTPLTADDVADCVVWAVTRPAHVNIDELVLRPRQQAAAHRVHRAE